jgi:FG-GAP-like repeat/FG-GAP repeat
MPNKFDRRGAVLRVFATGIVIAGLTSCGGSSPYAFTAPNSVVIADFNGDGFNDVAIANSHIDQTSVSESPGFVSVVLQQSSSPGTFQSPVHLATDGNPSAMAVGDIAGGGSKDLAVANFNKGTISVLLQTSPNSGTSFQNQISVPTGGFPTDVAICDVNGDGRADLVVANGDSTSGGSVLVIPQTAPGVFGAATTVGTTPTDTTDGATVPDPAYGVACANLNGDGHSMDIIVTSYYENFLIGYTYGASGMVSVFPHDPNNPGQFQARIDIPIQGILHRVVVADVNGDGLPDIVVSNEGEGYDGVGSPGAVVLLQSTPAGATTPTFLAPATIPTDSAVSIAVADLNGDGMPDIVIASGYQNANAVEVMFNTTTKGSTTLSFGAVVSYTGLGNPASVAIGDLNHDGLPDIATADGTGAVIYLQQTGANAGTFEPGVEVGS